MQSTPPIEAPIAFAQYSISHIIALALVFACALFVLALPLLLSSASRITIARAFGAIWGVLVALGVGYAMTHATRPIEALPLHLCDISIIMTLIALLTGNRIAFEFAYFFGLGGGFQALITPDLAEDFPSWGFCLFFGGHGGIFVGVALAGAAYGLRPHWASLGRTVLAAVAYIALAGLMNWGLDTNFGYLCAKPSQSSLLDYLGPWPWYVPVALGVSVVVMLILYLPWLVIDSVRSARSRHAAVVQAGGNPVAASNESRHGQ